MAWKSTTPPWLALRGALAGLVAFAAVVVLVALAVPPTGAGLRTVALVVLEAHATPGLDQIGDLEPLTWFALPAATLYVLAPLALATAGLVAGRWTRSADIREGVRAGLPVALGYVPAAVVTAALVGVSPAVPGGLALAAALVFGVAGGVVGVRT
ncbi:MAG: hypothetical protein ABEJ74_00795 [Haloferacaceae archaeon]